MIVAVNAIYAIAPFWKFSNLSGYPRLSLSHAKNNFENEEMIVAVNAIYAIA